MNPDFISICLNDPKGESSAFMEVTTDAYSRSLCFGAVISGKDHKKVLSLFKQAYAESEKAELEYFTSRGKWIYNRVEPQLPEDIKCCFFDTDLNNMKYKKIFLHGYENRGSWYEAKMPMMSISAELYSTGHIMHSKALMGDNYCSNDGDHMYVLCAAPYNVKSQEKELDKTLTQLFLELCQPCPENGLKKAEPLLRSIFPEGAIALAVDKGFALENVDWDSMPEKQLEGMLQIVRQSKKEPLYGDGTADEPTTESCPIKTGMLPTAGVDARIVDILSDNEIVILSGKSVYHLKKGEKLSLSREFDGYEDHEGVVWSTDTVTYTISFV